MKQLQQKMSEWKTPEYFLKKKKKKRKNNVFINPTLSKVAS